MNAAQALVQTLVAHGVDRIFCVPGESYLPVLDALHDTPQIQLISCRHEGGAGLMALADAKLTVRVARTGRLECRACGACGRAGRCATAGIDRTD